MNIKINNYKNLKEFSIDIIDNKVNYIFGISGSGKSSIGEAMSKEDIEKNVTINNSVEDVEILVNGKDTDIALSMYNTASIENILFNNINNNYVYDIIFDNSKKIDLLQNEFKKKVSELEKFREPINEYIYKIDNLNKVLGGKLTKSNELPASSKIVKLEKAITLAENQETVKIIEEHGNAYLPWIKTGSETKEFKEKVCPFCKRTLNEDMIQSINQLLGFNEKDFEAMFQDSSVLTNLGISIPNYSKVEEVNELKTAIINKVLLKEELIKLIECIDYYKSSNFNPSDLCTINPSDHLKEIFPGIEKSIDDFNKSIESIKKTLGELKSETNSLIAKNLRTLNSYLNRLGIKYNFCVTGYDSESNSMSYSLYHILDNNQNDRINGLSYGEKNIISLILFLLSSKDELLIIDDPASSFDDYRRKEILELIYDICPGKTILVLSHDQVFMKYAIFNQLDSKRKIEDGQDVSETIKHYYNNTGNITSLENYAFGNIKIKDISADDFDTLQNHIHKFMNDDMEYFRKIINLRLYYDCNKKSETADIYGYLSAIYHKCQKEEIYKMLEEKNITEKEIIDKIYMDTGINISTIPDGEYDDIDTNKLELFEKILYYRDSTEGNMKQAYSNVVHMNESLHICLNPYKFNYFSPYVYDDVINRN